MAEDRKFFTFLNITDGPDGTKNCTVAVTLTRPELRMLQDGKKVLTCPAAISNRSKNLSTALGKDVKDQDGTTWADVQFWNTLAERFDRFLNGRDKVRVIVCGRLSLREWTTKEGVQAQRVQISVNDWYNLPIIAPASNPSTEATGEDLF